MEKLSSLTNHIDIRFRDHLEHAEIQSIFKGVKVFRRRLQEAARLHRTHTGGDKSWSTCHGESSSTRVLIAGSYIG